MQIASGSTDLPRLLKNITAETYLFPKSLSHDYDYCCIIAFGIMVMYGMIPTRYFLASNPHFVAQCFEALITGFLS